MAAGGIRLQTSTSREHGATARPSTWCEIPRLSWSCFRETMCLTASADLGIQRGMEAASPRGEILLRLEKETVWLEQ